MNPIKQGVDAIGKKYCLGGNDRRFLRNICFYEMKIGDRWEPSDEAFYRIKAAVSTIFKGSRQAQGLLLKDLAILLISVPSFNEKGINPRKVLESGDTGENVIYQQPDRWPIDRLAASMFWGAPKYVLR